MPDPTTNYGWDLPDVGGDLDVWGAGLALIADQADAQLQAVAATGGGPSAHAMLIPAFIGRQDPNQSVWWIGAARPQSMLNPLPADGAPLFIPLLNLRPGQRITAFTSAGEAAGGATCTVKLYLTQLGGSILLGEHALSTFGGETTTAGLTHDVVGDSFYSIEFVPTGAGQVYVDYVKLTVEMSP